MGKKYLLYIHDERFDDEKEKSKLVNDLLKEHYDGNVYTQQAKTVYTYESPGEAERALDKLVAVDTDADWGA